MQISTIKRLKKYRVEVSKMIPHLTKELCLTSFKIPSKDFINILSDVKKLELLEFEMWEINYKELKPMTFSSPSFIEIHFNYWKFGDVTEWEFISNILKFFAESSSRISSEIINLGCIKISKVKLEEIVDEADLKGFETKAYHIKN